MSKDTRKKTTAKSGGLGAVTFEAMNLPDFDAAKWKEDVEADETLARLLVFYSRQSDQDLETLARKLLESDNLGALFHLMESYDNNAKWHRSATDLYTSMAARIFVALYRVAPETKRAA